MGRQHPRHHHHSSEGELLPAEWDRKQRQAHRDRILDAAPRLSDRGDPRGGSGAAHRAAGAQPELDARSRPKDPAHVLRVPARSAGRAGRRAEPFARHKSFPARSGRLVRATLRSYPRRSEDHLSRIQADHAETGKTAAGEMRAFLRLHRAAGLPVARRATAVSAGVPRQARLRRERYQLFGVFVVCAVVYVVLADNPDSFLKPDIVPSATAEMTGENMNRASIVLRDEGRHTGADRLDTPRYIIVSPVLAHL